MLILWDHPDSSNGLKVRFLLAELGLDHETRHVPMTRPRPADYLALNPLGGIPTLQDGDLTLSESQAILRYLARREDRDDLYPRAAREQAVVDQFLERWTNGLRTALFRVEMHALGWTLAGGFAPENGDAAKAQEAALEIAPQLTLLDGLVGEEFTVLGRFTIADCSIAPALYRTIACDLDLRPYPRLRSLRDALIARPGWSAAKPAI